MRNFNIFKKQKGEKHKYVGRKIQNIELNLNELKTELPMALFIFHCSSKQKQSEVANSSLHSENKDLGPGLIFLYMSLKPN